MTSEVVRGSQCPQWPQRSNLTLELTSATSNTQVYMCYFASHNCFDGLSGHICLLMTPKVISDLRFALSDLNYVGCPASLASKCLNEMIERRLIIVY